MCSFQPTHISTRSRTRLDDPDCLASHTRTRVTSRRSRRRAPGGSGTTRRMPGSASPAAPRSAATARCRAPKRESERDVEAERLGEGRAQRPPPHPALLPRLAAARESKYTCIYLLHIFTVLPFRPFHIVKMLRLSRDKSLRRVRRATSMLLHCCCCHY